MIAASGVREPSRELPPSLSTSSTRLRKSFPRLRADTGKNFPRAGPAALQRALGPELPRFGMPPGEAAWNRGK